MVKEKKKMKRWEKAFCLISFLFIIGCCVFYGTRLVKYYKIFNPPKKESNGLLSVEIPKTSTLVTEGDGLYRLNGAYVYKGDVDNNYIMYSGLLFRIVKINYASTTELILDSKINILAYGDATNYENSDINNYLNNVFIKSIDDKKLDKISICLDAKTELSDTKCKKTKGVYSTIIDSNTFLNTVNNTTYINEENSLMYLRDVIDGENGNVIANGSQISYIDGKESYDIKPMISLKYDTKIIGGTGTKDDPYIVLESDSKLGKTTTLGGYDWTIIKESADSYTLSLNGVLNTLKPFGESFNPEDENSIAYYLNNEFLESLDFKDNIIESTWEVGTYSNSYTEIEKDTVKAKVGMLSVKDFKMNDEEAQYLLLNKASDEEVYAVDKNMYKVDIHISKAVKPVIVVKASAIGEVK